MAALAQRKMPIAQEAERPEEVLVHVRFQPNADIFSIDSCPENLSPREWYIRLLDKASDHYQTLAGGRGFFRIPRSLFDAILSQGSK